MEKTGQFREQSAGTEYLKGHDAFFPNFFQSITQSANIRRWNPESDAKCTTDKFTYDTLYGGI